MKTFEQCKEEVAIKHSYPDWPSLLYAKGENGVNRFLDETIELYAEHAARDAWGRACDTVARYWELEKYKVLSSGGHMRQLAEIAIEVKKEYQPNPELLTNG